MNFHTQICENISITVPLVIAINKIDAPGANIVSTKIEVNALKGGNKNIKVSYF